MKPAAACLKPAAASRQPGWSQPGASCSQSSGGVISAMEATQFTTQHNRFKTRRIGLSIDGVVDPVADAEVDHAQLRQWLIQLLIQWLTDWRAAWWTERMAEWLTEWRAVLLFHLFRP